MSAKENKAEGFSEQVKKKRKDCVFLVRGKDNGKPAWHYVWVYPNKKSLFLEAANSGSLDVAEYGEIQVSGWGEDPDEETVRKIKEKFDIED